ncbi:PREDICTED: probable cytochrome P450 6a14 [Eufriesea mexicana]|uniref:probable cytochrome P450 6a14 n=1 Tax=Eufriesea mexicana TaxID=516756 RepID=UPI00083C2E8F|nr:PREDICTED: probable cytochrome P450 6a14 [Eufriesea mexicana]
MDYFQLLCSIGVVLLALYYYYTSTFDHWRNRGIPGPRPTVLVGNFGDVFFKKISFSAKTKKLYNEYKDEPVFGMFEGMTPILGVNDLDLIKDVFIKDFSVFADRGMPSFPKAEPLGDTLFSQKPDKWRPMRAKLSPVFTSGKLKEMFPLILECASNLDKYINDVAEKGEPAEFRDIAGKFTTDVIGHCIFGINMNALGDKDSEFRKMGKRIFNPTLKLFFRDVLRQFTPTLYGRIGHLLQPEGVDDFMINVIHDTIKYRKENNVFRPDFVNMLMDLKEHPEKLQNMELTDTVLAAQAFVFFAAGFETTSSTISHALYELAQHHDMQDKLREEIKSAYEKHGKNLTYEVIKEMKYLDKVFKETLRLYPVLPMVTREAIENYTLRGTKYTLEKGSKVWILVSGIHRDSNIFPNPDVFDPERFNDDAVAARHPMAYMPFGVGPRNCIGARFANYQSKIGIITILRNHKVDICEKTRIPYEADPKYFLMTLKDGMNLKLIKA